MSDAGAFAIVLEGMVEPLAAKITKQINIPTIGIGAGPHCDGQVLVTPDMFGLTGFKPKFMKLYADLKETAVAATQEYIQEVQQGEFPSEKHSHN